MKAELLQVTISQMTDKIRQTLAGLYPDAEIESLIRILFRHYCGLTPVQTYLHREHEISEERCKKICAAINSLRAHQPIQYILGETEFYGLPMKLTPDVLIPRPETEELTDWIINEYTQEAALAIADIGTGSGCIAIALAMNFVHATVWALDVAQKAIDVAQENARLNNVQIQFIQADILQNEISGLWPDASLDIIVSNPPYVTISEKAYMRDNVLQWEPDIALFVPDNNPLIFYAQIASMGARYLKRGGKIFFEINETFPKELQQLLCQAGYKNINIRKDINEKARMISAEL